VTAATNQPGNLFLVCVYKFHISHISEGWVLNLW
jgi:hypothetical protein